MVRSLKFLTLAAAGATGLALTAAPAAMAKEKLKGEEKLEKILEGRVAGEPVRCIRRNAERRMRVIDDTAYVYGSGRTLYVQRTRHPDRIDDDDILVVRKFGTTQLCRLDQITTVDRFSGIFSGAVFFDDFIPYTRVEQADEADG
ncbi:MAG: hypothetical protein AAGL68_10715 [Pseudomonadota bacterium]